MTASTPSSGSVASAVNRTADDLAARAHDGLDATMSGARSLLGSATDLAKGAVDRADQATHDVVSSSADMLDDLRQTTGTVATQAAGAIRRNPLLAGGLLLLAGYALAKLRR